MKHSTQRRGAVVPLIAAVTLATALCGAAGADAASHPSTSTLSCWFDISSGDSLCVEPGSGLIEAIELERGVELRVPAGAIIDGEVYAGESSRGLGEGNIAPAASTVVATLYEGVNYSGSTLVLSASGSCGTYNYNTLGSYGWNDRASSFRAYAGCRGTAYRDTYLTGQSSSTTSAAYSLGAINGLVSSFRVSP